MRYVCLAATFAVFSGLFQTAALAQGQQPAFSITDYKFVAEQRISQTTSYITYRASLVNPGVARNAVTASVTSRVASIQVVAGESNLHFSPVPANSTVPSLDTFKIMVDRTVAFDFADLQWSFLSPVANAGPNRTAKIGGVVILDGSGSTNPSGFGFLQYSWKLISVPVGSSTVLYWYDTVKPEFTVDVPGTYVVNLTVSNGSGSDSATVKVSTTNTAPVANAGANRTATPGTVVTLNGSGSSDVDGDPLTFSWTLMTRPADSTTVLLAPNTVSPVFTVDKPGSYDIRLIVNDGKVNSEPSTVTITTQNTLPVANAGPNQVRTVGSLVQLDGSGSTDVDGDPLTYQWSLITVPAGSGAILSSATAVKPTFSADRAGTYVAQLIVNDGKAASAAATVQITTNPPLAPTAAAGPNQTVSKQTTVHLTGSGTDPQGLPLTFQWSLSSKPPLSSAVLSSATIANPTFVADLPGTYIAQLIVSNGILTSTASMVTITTTNTAPVANPGLSQFLPVSAVASLSGAGSSDADGDPLTFAWSLTSRPTGSTAVLSSLTAISPTFFADVAGTYVVQLIVSDGFASSSPATVTITAGIKTISLTPNPLNLSTNTPGFLTLTMGSVAGPGGQIVALDSSNGTIAAIQANITVPQGMAGVNVPITPGSGVGSTTITASASGFTSGTAVVNVAAPTITVALSSGTVGMTRTVNGTLTLSTPAPAGGVSVSITDPAGIVTFQPASVAFAAGATTGTFAAKGIAVGSTTIVAGAPGYNSGSASLTVAMLGAITLLSNVIVGPNQSVAFPVSLVTGAPAGGVTIALSSSDTSKVTISPASVTILQGSTTPTQQPMITGLNLGAADISASAPGFFGATETVNVAANLSFQQQALTVGVNGTQNLVLNLSGAAPASGLTVNITSSNTAAVTVPTTVTFPPNQTSVNVPVTAIAIGTAIIHASSLPALADTTATVNVVNVGPIGLPANAKVGLGQTAAFAVTLPTPAPAGGVVVSLVSSDPSRLTISPGAVSIPAGQTGPATQPTITGVNAGTANITASATGFTAATQPVQVLASLSFSLPSLTITGASTANVVLNLSGPAPAGGLTVNLSSSSPSVASVSSTVQFPANATSVSVPVTGGTAGSTVVHASATNIPDTTLNVTVLSAGTISVPVTLAPALGQSLVLAVSVSTAPTSTLTITLASSDPSKVSLSSTTVTILAGQTSPLVQPQVTGANIGSSTITATAPGYTSGSSTVQVTATIAFAQPNITITGAVTQNLTLTLSAAAPAGGLTINLSSSNPAAATVPGTVLFAQGATTTDVPVTGIASGTTIIHASNLPHVADATANVTIQVPGSINLPSNPNVGLSQTIPFPLTLSVPAPSPVTIALVSSDTSKLTISASSISIAQGATAPTQQPTITGVNVGSASINATAAGYAPTSTTVLVNATLAFTPATVSLSGTGTQNLTLTLSGQAPSGGLPVNLSSSDVSVGTVPATITFPQGSTTVAVPFTIVSSGSTVIHASKSPYLADTTANVTVQSSLSLPPTLSVAPGQQSPLTLTLGTPAPAGGVTVSLSSSDTSKVTLVSGSVFIDQGQTTPNAAPAVNGINFGSAKITASANGYGSANTTVQVTGSASFFPSSLNLISGAGVQNLSLTLSSPAPSNITFTLNSSNPAVATAPASVVILANQNNVSVPITPVGTGDATITASTVTPNIANTTASVTVAAPGTITLPSSANIGLGKTVAFPVNLASPAVSSVSIALSSGNLSKLTISPGTVTIAAGQTAPAVQPQVTGLDIGAVTITASATGYATATASAQVSATISYGPPSMTIVGSTTQQFLISLSGPAPASGIVLTLSSSNPAVATVPPQQTFFPDGSSVSTLIIPVTVVGPGSTVIHAGVPPYIPDTTANVTVVNTGTIGLPSGVIVAPQQSSAFPVTLGTPAPTGGVTVSLASSDTSKLTITPASVTIAAGQTSPSTQPTVTGVNYGTANINATAPGYTAASSPVQVTAAISFASPTVTISGITTQNVALNLSSPAPSGGLLVNLSSSKTTAVTVPASVSFAANASTVNVVLTPVGPGTATITATPAAAGIANATTSVTVLNPGTINLPPSGGLGLGQTVTFPVTLSTPAVAPVSIALASSDSTKVTLSAATVTIATGQTTPATQPTITGIGLGASNITATATGFSSASSGVQVSATVVFSPPSLNFTGAGSQNLTLTLSAPAPAGGVLISLSSSNLSAATVPSTVTFTQGSTAVQVPVTAVAPGSATIHASSAPNIPDSTASITVQGGITLASNVTVPPGQSVPLAVTLGIPAPSGGVTVSLSSSDPSKVTLVSGSVFIAQGQTTPASSATVTGVTFGNSIITASANGYGSAQATVQVTGSASFFPASITLVSGAGAQNLSLTLSVPAPSNITFSLSSSNVAAATVPVSVTIPANQNNINVPVTPLNQGSTVITASTSTPNIANATASVTVTAPGTIGLPQNMSIGLSTTVDFPINLATAAPSGGVSVSLLSSDTSKMTISPGSVTIAAGQTTPATQPKVTASDIGAVTITASAPGYTNAIAPSKVTASITYAPTSLTIVGAATQNLLLTLSGSAPPGGITVAVSSSNPGVASVPQQVTFFPGGTNSTALLPVTGVAAGNTVVHVSAVPFIPDTTASVSVLNPGVIGLPSNISVGPTQSVAFPVTLGSPAPPGGVTVSLVSSNTSRLTISPASVSIAAGESTPATQPIVTGVNYGTADITATAPGYSSANVAVQVTTTMTFASPAVTINGITTQNVSLNLSTPAPAGGLTVNLTSSNTSVATVPATVNFPASATSLNVLITAVGLGPTTITATPTVSTIANAVVNVTVQNAGGINLSANTINLGQTVALPVTLSQPASSSVTIALASSDTSKVTVSTGSVTILAGQTAPASQPTITGVNLGSASITATSVGYTPGTAAIQVKATASFAQNLTIALGTGVQNLALNLSAPAPPGGVTVNLNSSNAAAATVPSTVTFNQGQSTVSVPVTALAVGTTVIHASKLPDIADATATVTIVAPATINLPSNPAVGLGASATLAVTLANPAPANLTIALASSDTSKVTISPASITILSGQTAPAIQPTIQGVNLGSASISATGTGLTTASTTVQVNATITFAQPNVTITGLATQNVALNLSGPAPAGGLTINLTSSNAGVATVPPSVSFSSGSTSVNVAITAASLGSTSITASAAAPNIPNATAAVSVVAAGLIGLPSNKAVGLGQSTQFAVTLPQAAPASVSVALSSSDTTKVTISPSSVTIAAGQTTPATQPTVTGVNLGSANINATSPGYTSSSSSVQVNATVSFTPPSLTISGFATKNLVLTLSAPAPAGGVTVNLTSSTPATATVPASVTFGQGATTVNVPVTGLSLGTTVVHASALPNIPDATANVTVQSAGPIGVPANTSVGLNQSVTFAISLPAPAPAPVTVTVSSSDSSKAAVSAGPFTIPQGATSPTTQPQVTGVNIGAVTITASAAGYTSSSGAAQVTATVSFAQPTVTISGIVTQNVLLNLSAPAPGGGLTVNLSSGTPGVATVPPTALFPQGATSVNVPVTAVSFGTAVIHASSTPFIADATTTVTVQSAGNVILPANSTISIGASAPLNVTLSAPAPTPLTVTLSSAAASTATISPATVTIPQGATTPATQPTMTGVNIGTVNITAAAPGYTIGTTSVQVNASVSFTPPTATITGLKTQNLTLTLSAAAPPAGVTINLSSSNTAVATVSSTVNFASGATTVNVPVTSLSLGSTVIHASATPFIPDVTANVTVVTGGTIGLPASVSVGLGASGTFAVTLPQAAPTGGTTVTLSSADTSKVTVTPATVTIAAGQTTPASQPTVQGVNVGSAAVSASAPGFTTANRTVTVGATVNWPQASLTLTALGSQNITLTLSAAAPAGGLTVNLSSSNQLVATVPPTATFTAGSTTVQVPVTASSEGSTVFHASGTNIPDAAANVTVTLPTLGIFTVANVTVGQNLQTQLQVNLSNPVPPGLPLQVTLTSSDGSKLVIGSLVVQGTASTILAFPVGSSSGIAYAQALAGSGTVTVTASAPGYTSGSGTVTLTPSAFVLTGPTGVVGVPSFPTNLGNTTPLTVSTGRLDSSLNYVESQGLRGGFSVSVALNSSNLTVGRVSPASVTFTSADTAYSTTFTALGVGSTLVSAAVPTGFSTPAGGANGITANVSPGGVTAPNATVGRNLEVSAQVTLSGAPSTDTVLTLTSSDPSRLRFGTSPTDPGVGTLPVPGCTPPVPDPTNACKIVKIRAGQSHSADFYIQALDSTGSATYTASVAGFGTSTGTVSFRPSGILIEGPFGLGNSFSVASGSAPTTLTIEAAMLDTSRNFVALQLVAPVSGVPPVSVNVTSSNTSAGTITASPVTIPAGSAGATTAFQAVSAGSTTLSVSVPTGFTAPAAFGSVTATVSTAGIAITDSVFIGKFLQVHGNFALGAPAPPGLIVTLTSSNPSLLLLSTSPTAAGSTSIGIPMSPGGTSGSYYLQALASSGTVTYTANAPGYAPRTGTITLTPSGVVLGDGTTVGGSFGGVIFGNSVVVSMAQLAAGSNTYMEIQQLAGGLAPVSIGMSTTVAGSTITTPVTIAPGTDSAVATLTGSGSGQVTATSPPGFTPSNFLSVNIFF